MALLEAGKKAPAFTLQNENGEKLKLKDILGSEGVVLFFYPKDNTPGCTKEACAFRDLKAEFGKLGWNIYGVSADPPESHQKFIAKQNLNFSLLADPEHKILEKFGVWQEKKMYGRAFMGIVRSTFLINAAEKIVKVYPKVKVSEHADQVLKDIQEL